jgi:hypothetical protein
MVFNSYKPFGQFPQFGVTDADASVARIRDMNERLIESSKKAGRVALDTYEHALRSMLDFQAQISNAGQLDWVAALASTHAQFTEDVTTAYAKAARDTLR